MDFIEVQTAGKKKDATKPLKGGQRDTDTDTGTDRHRKILKFFIKLQTNIRLYHWTTLSYSRHIATDKLDAALMPLVDDFVETFMAQFDRPPQELQALSMKFRIYSDARMQKYLARKRTELLEMNFPSTDLESLRDEIASSMAKTLYLFETI